MSPAPFNPISNPQLRFQRNYVKRREGAPNRRGICEDPAKHSPSPPAFSHKLFLFPNVQMATAVR